jgi:hypothetical protein
MSHKLESFVDALKNYDTGHPVKTNPVQKLMDEKTSIIKDYNDLEDSYVELLDDIECVLSYFMDKPDFDPNRTNTITSFLNGERTKTSRFTKKDFLTAYNRLVEAIHDSYKEMEDE